MARDRAQPFPGGRNASFVPSASERPPLRDPRSAIWMLLLSSGCLRLLGRSRALLRRHPESDVWL